MSEAEDLRETCNLLEAENDRLVASLRENTRAILHGAADHIERLEAVLRAASVVCDQLQWPISDEAWEQFEDAVKEAQQ